MRIEVNETSAGIVSPSKDRCKVKECPKGRIKSRRGHAFCKDHSWLRLQMPKKKFKDFTGNNEVVVDAPQRKHKSGPTSKRGKWKVEKNKILGK